MVKECFACFFPFDERPENHDKECPHRKGNENNLTTRRTVVYRTINYKITGQVKDATDGELTARIIEAELKIIAAKHGLTLEGEWGF